MGMKKAINHANRGKTLEQAINIANATYEQRGIAIIEVSPVPVVILKKDQQGRIKDGYIQEKASVDYRGAAKGRVIVFDAKETASKTRFPLNNVEAHQFEKLQKYHEQGSVSFLIIYFTTHQETYILPFLQLEHFWNMYLEKGAASIKYSWFKENCQLCQAGRGISLDYLAALPELAEGEEDENGSSQWKEASHI